MQGVNPMLAERLKEAIVIMEQLPSDAQEKIAAHLESAIANVVWDTDLNDTANDEWGWQRGLLKLGGMTR